MNKEYEKVVKEMGKLFPVMNIIINFEESNYSHIKKLKDYTVKYKIGISNITITDIKEN